MNTADESKKLYIAFLTIGLAAVGLVLGLIFKTPLFGTFSLGTWLCFVGFLLSLASVRNRGSNFFPMLAFWLSFGCMSATIFLSSLGA